MDPQPFMPIVARSGGDRHMAVLGASLSQLLICVMLLGVLAALIHPAIQKARQYSNQVKCVSNLRHYGIAVAQRIADTGDFPPYKQWFGSEGGAIWRTLLLEYMPVDPYVESCPAKEVPYWKATRFGYKSYDTSAANYGWSVGAGASPFKKISAVPYPSKVFLLADAGSWAISSVLDYSQLIKPDKETAFSFRHNGRANILFLDGHVESRSPQEIPLYRPRLGDSIYFWDEE